eukprot:403341351
MSRDSPQNDQKLVPQKELHNQQADLDLLQLSQKQSSGDSFFGSNEELKSDNLAQTIQQQNLIETLKKSFTLSSICGYKPRIRAKSIVSISVRNIGDSNIKTAKNEQDITKQQHQQNGWEQKQHIDDVSQYEVEETETLMSLQRSSGSFNKQSKSLNRLSSNPTQIQKHLGDSYKNAIQQQTILPIKMMKNLILLQYQSKQMMNQVQKSSNQCESQMASSKTQ